MLEAVMFGHRGFRPVIDAIIDMAEECAKEPWDVPEPPAGSAEAKTKVYELGRPAMEGAYALKEKQARQNAISTAKSDALAKLEEAGVDADLAGPFFKDLERDIVRGAVLDTGKRIDDRDLETVRPIDCEVGILPRQHGSALFTRGETQAIVVSTLGTSQDEQIVDALDGEYREHFLLHYNFPPYSTGEARMLRAPGRREIGHGKLAWRAVRPLLPKKEDFPYTVRVVSEITESNGSSSMASVCGASLSLMDAGVPLKRPGGRHRDGAHQGRRAFRGALGHSRRRGPSGRHGLQGRRHGDRRHLAADGHQDHLDHRGDHAHRARPGARRPDAHPRRDGPGALSWRATDVSDNRAAHHHHVRFRRTRSATIIGSGGKVIREICRHHRRPRSISTTTARSRSAAVDPKAAEAAINMDQGYHCREPEVGAIYTGKVVKIVDFGAFVNFIGKRDGLVHISETRPAAGSRASSDVLERRR